MTDFDGRNLIYEMATNSILSQSEKGILDALGCDMRQALEMARAGRIICLNRHDRKDAGETYCLDGKPFLWMGPVVVRIDNGLPDHVSKLVVERQMRKLP